MSDALYKLVLLGIYVGAVVYDVGGQSEKERYFECFMPRLSGQQNCSLCANYYVFNKEPQQRRCEHVNGGCYPYRTVFRTLADCERMCRPFIRQRALGSTSRPPYTDATATSSPIKAVQAH